ncbi:hypothetical protein BZARG_1185 [Bizionia argentinensis JUB59]|uniref:Uncharacterized protein n=1 Tax=Bizionia argentinensis JUB59 TaxID=1046627 RepID=G2ECR6_9FLAO|nr:hypothetical protein [Bizionia argentinensis]EGV43764.1 hypothetical protein BZARG_1185 [Bizionia argentinensis JUB59]
MKTINKFRKYSQNVFNINKNVKTFLGILTIGCITLYSCSSNDDATSINDPGFNIPSAQEFKNIRSEALNNITQNFQFNADDGIITLTSDNGVEITLDASCLTKNGNAVSGMVDLEYVEIFEKGNMLTTNKPTMGLRPNGSKALIITGGEFYFEASQNDIVLESTCNIHIIVPAALTGGIDPDMVLWTGIIDANGDLTWDPQDPTPNGVPGLYNANNSYYALIQNFGWTNIDRFFNDTRPKTTIYVQAPTGFNYSNSAIYLSYDGENSGLAILDTYENGLFSEHYGEIPIGLECHVIFTSEVEGVWRYAIKPYTIAPNQVITFSMSDTAAASEADLIDMIDNLP